MVPPLRKWSTERGPKHRGLRLVHRAVWVLLWLVGTGLLLQFEHFFIDRRSGNLESLGHVFLSCAAVGGPLILLVWFVTVLFCYTQYCLRTLMLAVLLIGFLMSMIFSDVSLLSRLGILFLSLSGCALGTFVILWHDPLLNDLHRWTLFSEIPSDSGSRNAQGCRTRRMGVERDIFLRYIHLAWRILLWPAGLVIFLRLYTELRGRWCEDGRIVSGLVEVLFPLIIFLAEGLLAVWLVYVLLAFFNAIMGSVRSVRRPVPKPAPVRMRHRFRR